MRRYTAGGEDDAAEMIPFEKRQVRRRDIVRHENSVLGKIHPLFADPGKIFQEPLGHVFHVRGLFSQIFVFDLRDGIEMLLEGAAHRILGCIAFLADFSLYLLEDCRILQDHALDVEEGPLLSGNQVGHALLEIADLLDSPLDRGLEPFHLPGAISAALFLDGTQIQPRLQHVGRAAAEAGRHGETRQPASPFVSRPAFHSLAATPFVGAQLPQRVHHALVIFFAFPFFVLEGIQKARLNHDAGDLGGDGLEQADLVARKLPAARGLDHQDSQRIPPLDQGHPEEGMEALFSCLGKIFVAGVRQGVHYHDGAHPFDDQAGQPLVDAHGDLSDRFLVQTHGGAQGKTGLLAVVEVERADLRFHAPGDNGHDVFESLLQILGVRDQSADILQDHQVGNACLHRCSCLYHRRKFILSGFRDKIQMSSLTVPARREFYCVWRTSRLPVRGCALSRGGKYPGICCPQGQRSPTR